MLSAIQVAQIIINLANQNEEDTITNLKLNKLLYFAQGHHLAKTGGRLFADDIEAWPYGPVAPEVYHTFKVCADRPIPPQEDVNEEILSSEEINTLLDVMREYGKYVPSHLVKLTHLPGTPWQETAAGGVIDTEKIADYFSRYPIRGMESILASVPCENVRRDGNGVWLAGKEERGSLAGLEG
jgi:uncharacterized phage-associated protein